ncbi:MAG: patatin-like phospholipase family protein [Chlorobiaceae bacterium]|nr:patatin-like phospholipase family protein [Chlorobiaceae bacterium]
MKKIALGLGGGAVLGAAHVGVLKALDELSVEVCMVSGTSIGSFIAALFAFGKNWHEIRDIIFDLDWFDLSGPVLSQYGLLSNRKFGGIITDLLGHRKIEDAPIPLSMIATDIGTGRKVVFRDGDVSNAVMASSCIPGIFKPVESSGGMLVDGVLVENVPVSPLREDGAESIICVDLLACHRFHQPENIMGILLNAFYSAVTNTTAIQTKSADLCICPDLSGFNLVDTHKVPDIVEAGYHSAFAALRTWLERER